MKSLIASLALVLSTAAVAQDVQINMNPFGGSVSVQGPPQQQVQQEVRTTRTEEISGDGFKIVYKTSENGSTMLEVLEPQGVKMIARKGTWTEHTDTVPTSFRAEDGVWYAIVLRAPNGAMLEQKVQAKAGMTGSIRFAPPSGAPQPPPARAEAGPLPSANFDRLVQAIARESFSEGKLKVLKTALPGALLSVDQVGKLVDLFDFSGEKVEVVRLTKGQLYDRSNAFELYGHFDFDNDKEKVRALLEN